MSLQEVNARIFLSLLYLNMLCLHVRSLINFSVASLPSLSPEQGHPAAGDIRPKNLRDDFQEYSEGRLRRPWVYWGWRHSVLGCSWMRARQGHCTKATLLMSEGPQIFGWEERRNSHFLKTYYILVVWLISYNPHDIPVRWRSLFSRHKWRNEAHTVYIICQGSHSDKLYSRHSKLDLLAFQTTPHHSSVPRLLGLH